MSTRKRILIERPDIQAERTQEGPGESGTTTSADHH